MHWCADETNQLMAALPFVGVAVAWIRAKWRQIFHRQASTPLEARLSPRQRMQDILNRRLRFTDGKWVRS